MSLKIVFCKIILTVLICVFMFFFMSDISKGALFELNGDSSDLNISSGNIKSFDVGNKQMFSELSFKGKKNASNHWWLKFLVNGLRSSNEVVKNIAFRLIINFDESIPLCIDVLEDKEECIEARKIMARVLGEIGDDKAVAVLREIFEDNEENLDVREAVGKALGKKGCEQIIDRSIETLKDDDKEKSNRINAAWKLGVIGSDKAVSALRKVLNRDDEDLDVKVAVVKALGEIGGEEAVKILGKMLEEDDENKYNINRESPTVLEEVRWALNKIRLEESPQ